MMLSIVIAYLLIGNIVASEGVLNAGDNYLKFGFPLRSTATTAVALCWPVCLTLAIIVGFMQAEEERKANENVNR